MVAMQSCPQHEDSDYMRHASDKSLCCCTDWQPGGALPVAPSARCPEGHCLTPSGEMKPYVTPRALSRQEVLQVVADYARAAENAMAAGVPCACLLNAASLHLKQQHRLCRPNAGMRLSTHDGALAGFDGCEVHCANGYLPEQFLKDGPNGRQDEYGGDAQQRCKFVTDLVQAVCREVGGNAVGVR